ncbi:MAG: hypothetical protein U0003_01175 [Vampirovibrionales bacterium]
MSYGLSLPYGTSYGSYTSATRRQAGSLPYTGQSQSVYSPSGIHPVAQLWQRGTQWAGNQARNLYSGYQQFTQKHPYINAGLSAGAGMLTAMHTCPYAGMAAAAPGLVNAYKAMMPAGHPGVGGGAYGNTGHTFG